MASKNKLASGIIVLSFRDAVKRVKDGKEPHLLLGNGFSMAWKSDVFSYGALFDKADFSKLSEHARRAFDVLNTRDFEIVMRALQYAASVIKLYDASNKKVPNRILDDARGLRDVLVAAIAGQHPDRPGDVSPREYALAKKFLNKFHRIYTLNYDLLLYWALMQDEIDPRVKLDDGFRTPESGPTEYVTWEVENTNTQNVYYLHGALHLFDAGHELQKYTWVNTGVPLMDQIRAALDTQRYPLFVAEGDSQSKLTKINHSSYLGRGYRSFANISGPLFIFGHSIGAQDEHIIHLIEKNDVSQLFISLHGDPNSATNKKIRERARTIQTRRRKGNPVEVTFFDADSAHVWR